MMTDFHASAFRGRSAFLGILAKGRGRAALAIMVMLQGCSTVGKVSDSLLGSGPVPGQQGYVSGFLGGVVADEPRAVLAGREVLSAGGTAADAAAAVALTLTVTLPSRAGLGGGGACIAYFPSPKSPNHGEPEAVMFTPLAPASSGASGGADRPAAVPMMARGLYLLHARYGSLPFEGMLSSAEQLARFGVPTSRALAKDIALVSGPLFADPGARSVFSQDGVPLTEGQTLRQPDLGGTLAQLRVSGVGDMYQGTLARRIEQGSESIGGPLQLSDLRAALPKLSPVLVRAFHNDKVAFLPPPADGGLGAEAAFNALADNPADMAGAQARALAAVARYRAGGVTPAQALATTDAAPIGTAYPASTGFVTMDRYGDTVTCALTMDNLFGTGRVMPGLGILAAASPKAVTPPLLSAGLVWNDNLKAFRAAASGSGQEGASLAVAAALVDTLKTNRPMSQPVPEPGRANVIACGGYLPRENGTCGWTNDPRGYGLAIGAN